MEYLRGSEWRRWDLHIHTPFTQKNDQFSGDTEEKKWETFFSDIISYVNSGEENHKVAVLGITDYYSIDNYLKVISNEKMNEQFQMILPNIEMRITPVSSRASINIHFLVNPGFVPQLKTKVFNQLKFRHSNGQIFYAVREDFIKLGRLKNCAATEREAYTIGLGQFVVELSNLKEILSDVDVRNNILVAVSNSSNDGVSGIGNPSCINVNSDLTALRDDIYYFSDLIFSSTESTIQYFLGRAAGVSEGEIKRKYGKLKPCVHGCDAHKNSEILAPHDEKFCWIKADCTFEGLKQIVFEPAERVFIGCNKPDNKKDYNVIDRVVISDENFSPEPIFFNPNLTCIIGGRSTGKSILLNNMARQIDKEQFVTKSSTNGLIINGLKVVWNDGYVSNGVNNSRAIVYIPQTYLNRLSDEQEEKTEIDDIIQSILLQDTEISKKYASFEESLREVKKELDKEILDLITSFNDKKTIEDKLKDHGASSSISRELQKLREERDCLAQSLNISEDDIKEYERLKAETQSIAIEISNLEKDCLILDGASLSVLPSFEIGTLSKSTSKEVIDYIASITTNTSKEWIWKKNFLQEKCKTQIKTLSSELIELTKKLKETEVIIEKSEAVKVLNKDIKKELLKLEEAKRIESALKEQNEKFDKLFKAVIHKIAIFDALHQEFASFINQRTNVMDESIKFIASAPFRNEQFDAKVRTMFDNRKLRNIYCSAIDGAAGDIDEESLTKLIKPLFDFEGLTFLKKGFSIEEVLRAILSNWYNIIYTVELDGDTIQTMSPGKKAIVLLKLLITLADAECPILIDQPEDDLDNRSIYRELVNFIELKKTERQIIIVTHNANIVVGADTEEIIVANQQGANSPNEKCKFEYRSGAIENNNKIYDESGKIKKGILNRCGIQEHICGILEGGKEAFNLRSKKYTLV